MKYSILAIPVLLLAACGTTMSPEQLKAIGASKDNFVSCTKGNSPWGTAVTVMVQTDKITNPAVVDIAEITVNENCLTTVKKR